MDKKIMNISLPAEFHKRMKSQACLRGESIKQYIIDLVEEDLKKEDKNVSR